MKMRLRLHAGVYKFFDAGFLMNFLSRIIERITGKNKILNILSQFEDRLRQLEEKIDQLPKQNENLATRIDICEKNIKDAIILKLGKQVLDRINLGEKNIRADIFSLEIKLEERLLGLFFENIIISNPDNCTIRMQNPFRSGIPENDASSKKGKFSLPALVEGRMRLAQQLFCPKFKYVHIGQTSIFMNDFADFINKNLNKDEHLLLILCDNVHHLTRISPNMMPIDNNMADDALMKMILESSEKIFIHGLYGLQYNFIKSIPNFWQRRPGLRGVGTYT